MELATIEQFRNLVLKLGLPRTDMVLFGVICPYCGKNDRIRPLEPPEELNEEDLGWTDMDFYRRIWSELQPKDVLAVCKFCHNIMQLQGEAKKAIPLYEW
ncbi:hypothetical protein G7K71_06600 [Desulfofundulus sp. TPOSR]|jgi:hypothetical protein|uniref:hypothetical protein n=1 Tax=Desulfofundulus sp. TPOSR TaxID=2714340 RepID=UPI0014087878|nr:hypothetical protein [Desulfofundulus sp. TPOSR]NHM26664.1 hypothetical protein [Desulfofundulus sp. TPOSR]